MFIQVAVPVPALGLLTYGVPSEFPRPVVGARVVVPLGNRLVTGVVVEIGRGRGEVAGDQIRQVRQVLDEEPFVPSDVVTLAQWTAEYYAAGDGEAILAALPPGTRGHRRDAFKTANLARLTDAGQRALREAPATCELTVAQRAALQRLDAAPKGVRTSELADLNVGPAMLSRLSRRGLVAVERVRIERDPFAADSRAAAVPARTLTSEQAEALRRLEDGTAAREFRVALLHGVTGSGKTEIYRRLAATVRDMGRTSLVLVPEIGLTPAIASIFRDAFGDRVAVQHSALSDGERHDQWQRIRRGDVDVVVGTRSAVFSPLERLGLIVVDEEHDASYKQEESPRYHARDVAIVRGRGAHALVVLGSATPSMETYRHALGGKYEHIVLERRVLDRPLAAVTIVDMRQEYAVGGPDVVLSRALADAIGRRTGAGEQTLVLLNRRGFSTAVFCRQCAGTIDCPNCSVTLVIHGQGASRRACCHYCNYTARVPAACPACAAPYLEQMGFGTERVEDEVRRLCPSARVGRLDRDAVRRKGALARLLQKFREGLIDVLVGTQMIAKGHDFPRVTLVGVVSADVGLGTADFRASERTFQLLTQVAGRAGRGEQAGEAIVQTLYPTHYSIDLACRQDYPAFYKRELHFRQAMRYPPLVALVNGVVRARTSSGAMSDAAALVHEIQRHSEGGRAFQVLGPAPAPLGRLRGEYRAQFLVKGGLRKQMREAVRAALVQFPQLARRTTIDIDPVNVL